MMDTGGAGAISISRARRLFVGTRGYCHILENAQEGRCSVDSDKSHDLSSNHKWTEGA